MHPLMIQPKRVELSYLDRPINVDFSWGVSGNHAGTGSHILRNITLGDGTLYGDCRRNSKGLVYPCNMVI